MEFSASVSRVLGAVGFAALALVVVAGQQAAPQPAPVFTAAQAQAGGALYAQNCSACHGANFEGSGDAPALSGGTFRLKWGPKMVSELFGVILQTMPPTNPGSLGEAAALNATAYILQRNGAQAGQQALTLRRHDADQRRGHRARRRREQRRPRHAADAVRAQRCWAPAIDGGPGQQATPARQRGVSVQGEVKNFVPVTPEMLKNPPAEDWLIFRPQLPAAQLQPAEPDHARQREEPAVEVGLGDERLRREPDDADRPQRRHLSREPQQHRAGARRRRRAI